MDFLLTPGCFLPTEHSLERSAEYLKAGRFSIGQPGIAFLPTQRPLQDRAPPGVDQRFEGTAGQDPGLPLRHLRGPDILWLFL